MPFGIGIVVLNQVTKILKKTPNDQILCNTNKISSRIL